MTILIKKITPNQNGLSNTEMIKKFVAITPLLGAITFPLIVQITISKFGINYGIFAALLISSLWFIAMLRTSEMPH